MSLWNSTFRNPGKPLKRTKAIEHKSAIKSGKKKLRQRGNGEDKLCRGQRCYVLIPGVCRNDPQTVVPAHSNQLIHGKGKGIKANDKYTVPACFWCHYEIDQGKTFTKEEKFAFWDEAYARWEPVRDRLMAEKLGE